MLPEYCIKVSLSPHKHGHPDLPYYWSILELRESWGQILCGWSSSPQAAFHDAMEQYRHACPAIIPANHRPYLLSYKRRKVLLSGTLDPSRNTFSLKHPYLC